MPSPVLTNSTVNDSVETALTRMDSLSGESDNSVYLEAWLGTQCSLIAGSVTGVLVLGAPDVGPYVPAALWPAGQPAGSKLADTAEQALQQIQLVTATGTPASVIAMPVLVDGHLHGVAAVETLLQQPFELQEASRQLRWGLSGIESFLRRGQSTQEHATRERLIATLDLVASALIEEGFELASHALATDLALRLGCDRVAIGFVRNHLAKVVAVSHSADFGERMNLIRAIGTAMDEAIDQRSIVVIPARPGDAIVDRDHSLLARQHGSDNILTIPFSVGKSTTGAVTFERPAFSPFDADTIELCQAVVALSSRILDAKRLNDRNLVTRLNDAGSDELRKLLGPRHFGRKLFALVIVGAAVFFSYATGNYRVGASATLEAAVRRVLVAPFDGYIASAEHRAGDVVTPGTVIAALDDRDLQLEYGKWASQRLQYGRQYQESVAKHDRALSSITVAQVQQAEAQMSLLTEQLARTRISSPFKGLIVSGDLNQSLGVAVKRGQVLFEVAPLDAYRVILDVDETDITHIRVGLSGNLVLTSLSGEVFPLYVTRITPITQSREGRSYFRVEASMENHSNRLRPGMEGVAKIEIGERKLLWIWTHKMVDWLHLMVWSWL